jgi:hypothetical protein
MDAWPLVENVVGAALGGSAAVFGLSKYLGDRWLEGLRARHSTELAEMQNAFAMGTTSHMATVAFDRHIGFCEEYVEEISKALYSMIDEGPAYRPVSADGLLKIRQKWILWVTRDIETELDRFEDDLRRIGAAGVFLSAGGVPESNESDVKRVIAYLRNILAIEKLTALRNDLIERSSQRLP